MLPQVFPSARADAAKVIVLVSDGKDDDRRSMIMSMMPLRLSDVTFFTVGVGQQVDMDEMTQIASSPVCSHSYYTSSHQQLSDLRMAIERISCRGESERGSERERERGGGGGVIQVDIEMIQIASSPICSYSSHHQLSDLRMTIVRISCDDESP